MSPDYSLSPGAVLAVMVGWVPELVALLLGVTASDRIKSGVSDSIPYITRLLSWLIPLSCLVLHQIIENVYLNMQHTPVFLSASGSSNNQ